MSGLIWNEQILYAFYYKIKEDETTLSEGIYADWLEEQGLEEHLIVRKLIYPKLYNIEFYKDLLEIFEQNKSLYYLNVVFQVYNISVSNFNHHNRIEIILDHKNRRVSTEILRDKNDMYLTQQYWEMKGTVNTFDALGHL